MLCEMPAAASRHRVSLLVTSIALYPAILAAFYAVERPGLGIGHFYYFPSRWSPWRRDRSGAS